ncbi:hypothetical protein JCM11641_006156 [Rhodosporidiobolus odoratus]
MESSLPPSSSSTAIRPIVRSQPQPQIRCGSSSRERSRSRSQSLAPQAATSGAGSSIPSDSPSSLARLKSSLFGAQGTAGTDGKSRPGMPRSASSNEILAWRTQQETGTAQGHAESRKASDASWISQGSGVRFAVSPENGQGSSAQGDHGRARDRSSTAYSSYSRSTGGSLFSPAHQAYASSSTSLHPTSLSLARTRSGTSSSTASSEFPPTPAQNAGSVVYRSRSNTSVVALAPSRKGKEPDHDGGREVPWKTGVPILSPPISPQVHATARRTPMPALIDPRFTFPMRRGGLNNSGSGSGSAQSRPIGLGFNTGTQDEWRGSWNRDTTEQGNGTSFVASLGSRPLVDDFGRPLPSFQSYASPPSAAVTPSPKLALLPPHEPFSPTSPITSTFPSTEPPVAPVLDAPFSFSSMTSPRSKAKRSGTFSKRRAPRNSTSIRATSPRSRARRRSTASSAGSIRSSSGRVPRSASLPNLRDAASSSPRRPSIPFETFEPRGPRTRSPRTELRARRSLETGSVPLVFPSKRSGSRTRKPPVPPRNPQRTHTRTSSHNVVTSGLCGSYAFAHPRVTVVTISPTASAASILNDDQAPDGIRRPLSPIGKGKAVVREGPLSDAEVDRLIDDVDRSSVRRVLLENEASRAERAAWSDSATKALGYGLSLRLADRERQRQNDEKNLAAAQKRKADLKRVRKDVARRKRQQAGTDSEMEDNTRYHSASGGLPALASPQGSPPVPHSFDPFTMLGRKLSLKGRRGSRDRRPSDTGVVSDGAGLGIIGSIRRKRSEAGSRPSGDAATSSATGPPSTPKTLLVRGQPIRHLRTASSVDSLYERANVAAGRAGQPGVPSVNHVATTYGQALTSPPDQPSPDTSERRRPSVQAQNAFLSLPPHLHHLLRSPERESFSPSRRPPPVPSLRPPPHVEQSRTLTTSASLPVLVERDSTLRHSGDSSISAARLNLALEEQLQKEHRPTTKQLNALPIATTSPLIWQSTESGPALPMSTSPAAPSELALPPVQPLRLAASRSSPNLASAAAGVSDVPSQRLTASVSSWLTTDDDPLRVSMRQGQHSSPVRPSPPRSMRRKSSSPSQGRHSRNSSGSSALNMDVEPTYENLFISPPRRSRPTGAVLPLGEPLPAAQSGLPPALERPRFGRVPTSPVEVQARPASMASHEAVPQEQEAQELLGDDSGEYESGRMRTTQKSIEGLFALPSTSNDTAPSIYLSVDEPSSYSTAVSGPSFLARPNHAVRNSSFASRPSTAQSTAYATAEEGTSINTETGDLPEIVIPDESPVLRSGDLALATSAPFRPLPTPTQTTWAATSFAREYLGSYEGSPAPAPPASIPSPPITAKRVSADGSGSGQSFLELADQDTEDEQRATPSPSSFIDFSPPSTAPNSPTVPAHFAPVPPSLPQSPTSESSAAFPDLAYRDSHLSFPSMHFVNPLRVSSSSRASGSHYSGLEDRLNDFPAPPVPVTDDSASDGDDEADLDEAEESHDATQTVRLPSILAEPFRERSASALRSLTVRREPSSVRSRSRSSLSLAETSEYTVQSAAGGERAADSSEDEDQGVRRLANTGIPNLAAFSTTTERPVSTQSWLDLSDSGMEEPARREKSVKGTSRSSGSYPRSLKSSSRTYL